MGNLLCILSGGSKEEKISAAFMLFDVNNSDTISYMELLGFI
jgi:Ca2+-binding EF-hand superfamily protein